jgi:hypothetical protein
VTPDNALQPGSYFLSCSVQLIGRVRRVRVGRVGGLDFGRSPRVREVATYWFPAVLGPVEAFPRAW